MTPQISRPGDDLIEEVAFLLLLPYFQDQMDLRLNQPDLSLEGAIKTKIAASRVNLFQFLPLDLAKDVIHDLKTQLGSSFDEILLSAPEAIYWEARYMVFGGDLRMSNHPVAASILIQKGIKDFEAKRQYPKPEAQASKLKKAIFAT